MRGFTVVEVVVALVILEIGLLATAGLITISAGLLSRAQEIEGAVAAAASVADSLGSHGFAGNGERPDVAGTVIWEQVGGESLPLVRIRVLNPLAPERPVFELHVVAPPPAEHRRMVP
jgi:type II secretory pathway pseudopilin PulG